MKSDKRIRVGKLKGAQTIFALIDLLGNCDLDWIIGSNIGNPGSQRCYAEVFDCLFGGIEIRRYGRTPKAALRRAAIDYVRERDNSELGWKVIYD